MCFFKISLHTCKCRATDKARKSVKTHWKNKQCVKIRISISRYALGVQSSAYRLSKLTRKQNWCPFVCLSTHCQWFPSHYKFLLQKQVFAIDTTRSSKSLPKLYLKGHKTADIHFKTVHVIHVPSLFSIAKKYRGWKYHLKFWNQHWVKN